MVTPHRIHESVVALNQIAHKEALQECEQMFSAFDAPYYNAMPAGATASPKVHWRRFGFVGSDRFEGSDATPPCPFGQEDLVRVSKTPVITEAEAAAMIDEANADWFGWRRAPKARYGTSTSTAGGMMPVEDLCTTLRFLNDELLPRLLPEIVAAFPGALDPVRCSLGVQAARLVKYDASAGHVELGYHRDGTLLTANIALNSADEYSGGGTLVESLLPDAEIGDAPSDCGSNLTSGRWRGGTAVRLSQGHVLLHPGNIRHGGLPITRGVRYVLVLFLMDESIIEHDRYCSARGEEEMAAAMLVTDDDEKRLKLLRSAAGHFADAFACGARVDDGRDGGTVVDAFREFGIELADAGSCQYPIFFDYTIKRVE